MDAFGMIVVFAFLAWVVLSLLYLLIKAAVREGIKEAFRDRNKMDEDDSR